MAPPFSLSGNKLRVYSSLTATPLRLVALHEHLILSAMRCFQNDDKAERIADGSRIMYGFDGAGAARDGVAAFLQWPYGPSLIRARRRSPLEYWRS
jgi:hypothetical protein